MELRSWQEALGEYMGKRRVDGALVVTLAFRVRIPDTMEGFEDIERRLEGMEGRRVEILNADGSVRMIVEGVPQTAPDTT